MTSRKSINWTGWRSQPDRWCWSGFPPPAAGASATPTDPGSSGCPIPGCNAPGAWVSKASWPTNCCTPGSGPGTVTRATARCSRVTPPRAASRGGAPHSARFAASDRNSWPSLIPGLRRRLRGYDTVPGFRRAFISAQPGNDRSSVIATQNVLFCEFLRNLLKIGLRFDIGNRCG